MRRLWFEVLALGLLDAARGTEPEWVGSHDFLLICDLLDLAPEAVAQRFHTHRVELAGAIGYRTNGGKRQTS